MSSSELTVDLGGQCYRFQRPADLETLWDGLDDDQLDADERIPYWVEIWPASILLASWIRENISRLRGRRCLDLGCGLGLCASVAAEQAEVLGADYEWSALAYARQSASANNASGVTWVQMDWRFPVFKPESFSFIWGAEIIYERRFFQPLLDIFEHSLVPGGSIWLASPDRPVSRPFWGLLAARGWSVETLQEQRIEYREYAMRVVLREIGRPDSRGSDRNRAQGD